MRLSVYVYNDTVIKGPDRYTHRQIQIDWVYWLYCQWAPACARMLALNAYQRWYASPKENESS